MQRASGIGGQALLEGIMMRNRGRYALAVRKSDHTIVLEERDYKSVVPLPGIEKIPILRGVAAFLDSLVIGTSCTMWSAQFFEEEEEEKEKSEAERAKEEKQWKGLMAGAVFFAVILAVGLFILTPFALSNLLRKAGASDLTILLLEALLRIAIFLGYMFLISRLKDIQRVFAYHGAEHKCINCVEHGLPLTVENVLKSSRQHKRCGTSFLLIVIVISVICFFLLGLLGIRSFGMRLLVRLLLIPVIAGISYELLRLAGKYDNPVINLLVKPGLALQKLVTKEPDAEMAEVAIAAVEAVFDWESFEKENFS